MGLMTLSRLEDKYSVVDKIWMFIFEEFRKYMKSFVSLQTRRSIKSQKDGENISYSGSKVEANNLDGNEDEKTSQDISDKPCANTLAGRKLVPEASREKLFLKSGYLSHIKKCSVSVQAKLLLKEFSLPAELRTTYSSFALVILVRKG